MNEDSPWSREESVLTELTEDGSIFALPRLFWRVSEIRKLIGCTRIISSMKSGFSVTISFLEYKGYVCYYSFKINQ